LNVLEVAEEEAELVIRVQQEVRQEVEVAEVRILASSHQQQLLALRKQPPLARQDQPELVEIMLEEMVGQLQLVQSAQQMEEQVEEEILVQG
jgi:hypothetical protein